MKLSKRMLLAVLILVCLSVVVIISTGYYLMSVNPILAKASGSNPLEALRIGGKVMINELIQTPVKSFDLQDADLKYDRTVDFPEDKLELTTAEQIIEWSVFHNDRSISPTAWASRINYLQWLLLVFVVPSFDHDVPRGTLSREVAAAA